MMDKQSNRQSPAVYAIATMDTKGSELMFVAERLSNIGIPVVTVDIGTLLPPSIHPDVLKEVVAACHPAGSEIVLTQKDRGRAVEAMGVALQKYLIREDSAGRVLGVIGLGGSGGTAMISPAMRSMPIGLPKVLVSTVAGGNVSAYVGCSDLIMFPSIVDVAGINSVSRQILSNAANALAGMVKYRSRGIVEEKAAVGMTMFGVTTPCVNAVRKALEADGFDAMVFHATGTGGQSMDKLVDSRLIRGVLDITTTEVADEIVGGIFPAGSDRFDAIISSGVPYVMSLGALDMVNFGAMSTVPGQFKDRQLHVHNPLITLLRTNAEENRLSARWIAEKVNRSHKPIAILIPEKGLSALDAKGHPFHNPEADEALFEELEQSVVQTNDRTIRRLPLHINDPEFAAALVGTFRAMWSAR